MYEFPRAAMNIELKRGRSTVTKFLNRTYGDTAWTRGAVHDWLKEIRPPYVIDINRDTQLQDSYADEPHNLIVGIARLGGTDFRYKLYFWDGWPTRKPRSSTRPCPSSSSRWARRSRMPSYIASDADYVDYITELMGGFSIPPAVKELRQGKQYLLIGLRLNRDTERMVMSDIIYAAAAAGRLGADSGTERQGTPLLQKAGAGSDRGRCLRPDRRRSSGLTCRVEYHCARSSHAALFINARRALV